jgi:PIN domain nuclease of toxin-antitoxin system
MERTRVILLDTHVVIWLARDHQRISAKAHAAIRKARRTDTGLAISSMTLLEIARLTSQARIRLFPDLETFLSAVEQRFIVLPITGRICVRAYQFPGSYPKDPADRVIGATSLMEGLTLISADEAIKASGAVPVVW